MRAVVDPRGSTSVCAHVPVRSRLPEQLPWEERRPAAPSQRGTRVLRKPSWTPPSHVFGPVWTVLYAQMAYSAILALSTDFSLPVTGAWAALWPGVL